MLDVRKLRLLRELAIRGTIAGVAEALSFSPSSVSQQLSALEREAGVTLLRKVGRRVQLTPQAELLAARTADLLDLLEQAESELDASLDTVTGVVRIAVFQSAAHAIVPGALSILAAEYPDLRVEVTEREPERGLFEVSARDFDLVIAEQYPGSTRGLRADLDRVDLVTDAIHLAVPPVPPAPPTPPIPPVPPRASGRATVRELRDAAELPWVMEPEGTAARTWAVQLCRSAGFEPDVRFETADLIAHIRLIRSGNAVGLLPDLVWAGDAPSVALVELPGSPRRTIFTSSRRSSAARPGVLACRDALTRAAQDATRPRLGS
ncbi:LysR family transcriptional regulator [Diaminobutyricibacter tongyongensis]|uniref:LysR family transcriptional regulator n=1 Tax=Leifsonia tongyongensis TaxID=1268043 RepID=A0A6L9XX20_9MICO|nr:LysR family transcriptional regulator [Diaminobutyricibacter tongyongensis]NEN05578.1 LysR family transcriptional regulator [Diaminobutyricibacter tongyongensis]